jgi:hypothetical protein
MKQCAFLLILLPIIFLACAALYWGGSYTSYNLIYIFCFIFLFFFTVFSSSTAWQKIIQMVIYALIMMAQILINTYFIQPFEGSGLIYYLYRFLGVIVVFMPFLVQGHFFFHSIDNLAFPMVGEKSALPYSLLLYDRDTIVSNLEKVKKTGQVLSKVRLEEIIQNLPRHSSFSYVNNGSLTNEYFQKAYSTLNNGYIYLIVAKTKTVPSEVIGLFTNKQYNHVSVSFDRELHTAISYTGGEKILPPGLNPELLARLTRNNDSAVLVYSLSATSEQKRIILDKIQEINEEGSAYNLLGLALKFSYRPNIMFCSQFVYTILKIADLNYFENNAARVKPTDFVELDYHRKLKFVYEITLQETNSSNGE